MTTWGKYRKTLLEWLQVVAHLCTFVALIVLLFQMKSDQDARRIELALTYVNQHNSEPISGHRENLDLMLLPVSSAIAEINSRQGANRPNTDRLIYTAISEHENNKDNPSPVVSIIQLTQYYDQLLMCRQYDLCDPQVIDNYFRANLKEFWGNYKTVICEARRAGTTGLGRALEAYAASSGGRCEGKI